jgi:ABC-type lipoprotein export system ATPase subunit
MSHNEIDKTILKIVKENFNSDWDKFELYLDALIESSQKKLEPNQNTIGLTEREYIKKIQSGKSEILMSLKDISKEYTLGNHKVAALKNINLDVYKGEFIAITGPSGSGKSTLLHVLGGLDKPDKGQVLIEGSDLSKFNDNELSLFRNKMVGFIFQSFYLQPYLNVLQNTEIPLIFRMANESVRKAAATNAIDAVGLSERIMHLPKQLSGGQMQRVGIARAIVNDPKIVLADEPTANLDKESTQDIINMLKKINKEKGITIVVVTHNDMVAQHADRIIKLEDGEIK